MSWLPKFTRKEKFKCNCFHIVKYAVQQGLDGCKIKECHCIINKDIAHLQQTPIINTQPTGVYIEKAVVLKTVDDIKEVLKEEPKIEEVTPQIIDNKKCPTCGGVKGVESKLCRTCNQKIFFKKKLPVTPLETTVQTIREEIIKPKIEIIQNRQQIIDYLEDVLDYQFPKGECKERGHALVLFAEMVRKLEDMP